MYREEQLVRIAKRENNNKRKYLVVNALQAKHIPADPKETLAMCGELADVVKANYQGESLLLVGFAETATAIGAALAVNLDAYYMQTTREQIDGVEYLFFTESHSHATEQRLVKTDLDAVIDKIQRIVFVEDEVTTGNTILKIVELIEKNYPGRVSFSVASLLNGMNREALAKYQEKNIGVHYLVKTDHSTYTEIAEKYAGDGAYHDADFGKPKHEVREVSADGYMNARRLVKGGQYREACERLWKTIEASVDLTHKKKVLVLGTEECMYPAVYAADKLTNDVVRTHSTTRSPIAVSTEAEYPLHSRYELMSLFEADRRTFIYDLDAYDAVLIITDAAAECEKGINSLINAVEQCGSRDITLVRWC